MGGGHRRWRAIRPQVAMEPGDQDVEDSGGAVRLTWSTDGFEWTRLFEPAGDGGSDEVFWIGDPDMLGVRCVADRVQSHDQLPA
ncbi:hypothetical protein D779_0344 [Imhoffiella purpurea]|uniref:Uncharacterized protein n=1 Tax=Imhoffiella purpurea TaxID=1249627 RepID=W9W1E5_9GAMM|nr:hypothetical protein D779_0344 [Imhoffiella purpurea]